MFHFQQSDTVDWGGDKCLCGKYEGQSPVGKPGRTVSGPELSDVEAAVRKGTLAGPAARGRSVES